LIGGLGALSSQADFGHQIRFERLSLQVLVVKPLQKIHIIEPFVSTVGFVHNAEGNCSQLQTPGPQRGTQSLTWTTPAAVSAYLLREWDRVRILSQDIFPLRIPLKGPNSQGPRAAAVPTLSSWSAFR